MNVRKKRKINNVCDCLDETSPIGVFPTNPFDSSIPYYNKSARYRLSPDSVDEIEARVAYMIYEAWKFRDVNFSYYDDDEILFS